LFTRAANLPPLVAPSVGNAVFNLAGKRLRAMPMSPERVKAVTGV
jgi:CO/xanthine dehydrogenase Mo-binding subunit